MDTPILSVHRKNRNIVEAKCSYDKPADDGKNHLEYHETCTIAERSETHDFECFSHPALLFLNHVLDDECTSY